MCNRVCDRVLAPQFFTTFKPGLILGFLSLSGTSCVHPESYFRTKFPPFAKPSGLCSPSNPERCHDPRDPESSRHRAPDWSVSPSPAPAGVGLKAGERSAASLVGGLGAQRRAVASCLPLSHSRECHLRKCCMSPKLALILTFL